MEDDPFGFDDGAGGNAHEEVDPFQEDDRDHGAAGYDAFGDGVGDDGADEFGTHTFEGTGDDFCDAGADETIQQQQQLQQQQIPQPTEPSSESIGGASLASAEDEDDGAALRQFEAKWRSELEEKEKANKTKREQMKEAAKAELSQFYSTKESSLASKKARNRETEQEQQNALEGALASENPWEMVSTLIDLSGNGSDAASTARQRNLLIQLKNAPIEAK